MTSSSCSSSVSNRKKTSQEKHARLTREDQENNFQINPFFLWFNFFSTDLSWNPVDFQVLQIKSYCGKSLFISFYVIFKKGNSTQILMYVCACKGTCICVKSSEVNLGVIYEKWATCFFIFCDLARLASLQVPGSPCPCFPELGSQAWDTSPSFLLGHQDWI